jgi:hypothetical protein
VTPERIGVLFEGGRNAVDAQIEAARALIGGRRRPGDEVWEEVRIRARSESRNGGNAAAAALLERIRAGFDPAGVLRVA